MYIIKIAPMVKNINGIYSDKDLKIWKIFKRGANKDLIWRENQWDYKLILFF